MLPVTYQIIFIPKKKSEAINDTFFVNCNMQIFRNKYCICDIRCSSSVIIRLQRYNRFFAVFLFAATDQLMDREMDRHGVGDL